MQLVVKVHIVCFSRASRRTPPSPRSALPLAPSSLQPVHAQRSKGLRGGASPLLLPGRSGGRRSGRQQAACSLLEPAALPPGSCQLDQLLPSAEVLERSEFLEPLSPETAALYRRLLHT